MAQTRPQGAAIGLLRGLSAERRLYDFWINAAVELHVEAFHGIKALSRLYAFEVICLSLNAHIPLKNFFKDLLDGFSEQVQINLLGKVKQKP